MTTTNDAGKHTHTHMHTHTQHLMILVHGITGTHKELLYVKEALERAFEASHTQHHQNTLLVHAATTNDENTLDGIEAGGKRLAKEINDLVKTIMEQAPNETIIALSLLGNSLGGLYARYALAHIDWHFQYRADSTQSSKSVRIFPNMFVTTATPHLGIRDMTYWKIPKSIQPVGAWYLKESGNDLFRNTDTIHRMCLDETFLTPLANFSKRIAYANAFSTDAAVPTSTAAFLSASSSTPHRRIDSAAPPDCHQDQGKDDGKSTLFHVNASYPTIRFQTHCTFSETRQSIPARDGNDPVASYALSLDSLGWTKVFLDVRSHIPALWKRGTRRHDLHEMAQEPQSYYTSSELHDRLSVFDWNTLPFGHSFIVASTKNPMYTWFYSGGRPLVDLIAKELVQEMIKHHI